MKKLIPLAFSILLMTSCSSGGDDSDPTPNPTPTNVTYNGNIKSIMTSNCTSCHGNPTSNGAPMSLTTYSEVVDAVNNRNLINRINSTSNPMPVGGLMPSNTRQLIQTWVNNGMPEN